MYLVHSFSLIFNCIHWDKENMRNIEHDFVLDTVTSVPHVTVYAYVRNIFISALRHKWVNGMHLVLLDFTMQCARCSKQTDKRKTCRFFS